MERREREEGSKEGDREEGEVRERVEERGRGFRLLAAALAPAPI